MRVALVVVALVAMALPGCLEPVPTAQSERAIVGGVAAADESVCAIKAFYGSAEFLCTGVLIAPRVVLTAAHCLNARDRAEVYFGASVGAATEVGVVSWALHPSWSPSAPDLFNRTHDLAVILLAEAAPVAPVGLQRAPLGELSVGAEVRLVGFGDTSDQAFDSGVRRTATTALRELQADWTIAGDADANTCVGDSGGPQFMTFGGQERIVSITSFGQAPLGEMLCRFDTVGARIDIDLPFIDDFVAASEPAGDQDAGADPSDAGEGGGCSIPGGRDGARGPATLPLLLLGALFGWRTRRPRGMPLITKNHRRGP